jgi:hypothetical protein
MTVQEGLGTQATVSTLIEEEASTLTHLYHPTVPLAVFPCLTDMVLLCANSLQMVEEHLEVS